jgi:hypothetical protein
MAYRHFPNRVWTRRWSNINYPIISVFYAQNSPALTRLAQLLGAKLGQWKMLPRDDSMDSPITGTCCGLPWLIVVVFKLILLDSHTWSLHALRAECIETDLIEYGTVC